MKSDQAIQSPTLKRIHMQRLRQMYRSAGWPCLDTIEIDLIAAGLLERIHPEGKPEYLRVSDAGMHVLAESLQTNVRPTTPMRRWLEKSRSNRTSRAASPT